MTVIFRNVLVMHKPESVNECKIKSYVYLNSKYCPYLAKTSAQINEAGIIVLLLSSNRFENVRTVNAAFSLAQRSLTMGWYCPVPPVVKKDGNFVCKERRTGEAKTWAKKRLQSDVVFFLSSYLSQSYLVIIEKFQFVFGKFLTVSGILPSVIATTLQTQSVLRPWALFHGTDRKNSYSFISIS